MDGAKKLGATELSVVYKFRVASGLDLLAPKQPH